MLRIHDIDLKVSLRILVMVCGILVLHTIWHVHVHGKEEKVTYIGVVDRIETNGLAVVLIEDLEEEVLIPIRLIGEATENGWISLEIGSHRMR